MVKTHFIFTAVCLLCSIATGYNQDIFNDKKFSSTFSKHSVVTPQIIHRWTRSASEKTDGKEKFSFSININNSQRIIHLTRNTNFVSPNLVQYSHGISGIHKSIHPWQDEHCFYHGEVEGYESSLVALSACTGLRGVILLGDKSYGLEPVPESQNNEHLLYRLKDIESEPFVCGVASGTPLTEKHSPFEPGQSLTSLLRKKRNLPQTSYVELVLVVDNQRYVYKKGNETAVREEMVEMANLLDVYYKRLNIRVMLVGLEVFKDSNPFDVDGSAGEVVSSFVKWRKTSLLPRIKHDIGQLIVGRTEPYDGGVLGMAYVGTVCSVATSGGINVFSGDNLVYISTVVAHEMGHVLGMNHDSDGCNCNGSACIMAPAASGSTSFSVCSGRDFAKLILRGGGVCLRNQPTGSDIVGIAKCGNGLLERGEQCDCGTPEECKASQDDKCCDASTCKFTPGSVCAGVGECCNGCQFTVAGTQCRDSVNTCDLPEYCNGQTGFCPEDFYIMDGLTCENNAAYCYEGRCQTYDYQCQFLFEPGATKAADICFQHANVMGDKYGNCGITGQGTYIKCTGEDAMCGKVQCTNVDVNEPPPGASVSNTIIAGEKCVNADFNLGTDTLDPAYVNHGSPCAKGKTCMDFSCVNASLLRADFPCDAGSTCHGRGVCNNQGHCHCDDGWAPPSCDIQGRGGSIDSGPAQIDHSLRNGLLIFFLLIVPVLVLIILILLYVFRRDSLNPCLKSRRHRSSTGNTRNGQANGNVQASPMTQPPIQVPPAKPDIPLDSSQHPGFRYGELDYWNVEGNAAATTHQPQPPQRPGVPPRHTHSPQPPQGPGVPRAIPSKDIP